MGRYRIYVISVPSICLLELPAETSVKNPVGGRGEIESRRRQMNRHEEQTFGEEQVSTAQNTKNQQSRPSAVESEVIRSARASNIFKTPEQVVAPPVGDSTRPLTASATRPNTVAGTRREDGVHADSPTPRALFKGGPSNYVTKMISISPHLAITQNLLNLILSQFREAK